MKEMIDYGNKVIPLLYCTRNHDVICTVQSNVIHVFPCRYRYQLLMGCLVRCEAIILGVRSIAVSVSKERGDKVAQRRRAEDCPTAWRTNTVVNQVQMEII